MPGADLHLNFLPLCPNLECKAALVRMLQFGCQESELPPPFGELPVYDDTVFESIDPPFILVSDPGEAEPLSEGQSYLWTVPLSVTLYVPLSVDREWVEQAERQLHLVLSCRLHDREQNPTNRAPLAWRMTSCAAEASPTIPLYVCAAEIGQPERPETAGGYGSYEIKLAVIAGIIAT